MPRKLTLRQWSERAQAVLDRMQAECVKTLTTCTCGHEAARHTNGGTGWCYNCPDDDLHPFAAARLLDDALFDELSDVLDKAYSVGIGGTHE